MSQIASSHASGQSHLSPNGRLGMWWFLASEVTIFGGAIACFILLKGRHPEWASEATKTVALAGFVNTLILLTSSYTMAIAHKVSLAREEARTRKFLLMTLILGFLFLCVKVYEYGHKIHDGLVPGVHLYWSFYFFLTGLHALHVLIGLVLMGFFAGLMKRSIGWVENLALYWHLVDMVWIFLFPLLYLGA